MKINNISFTSNNSIVQKTQRKSVLQKRIENLSTISDICGVSGIILASDFNILPFTKKISPKMKTGIALALLFSWATTFTLKCINKNKYYKQTGKIFDA